MGDARRPEHAEEDVEELEAFLGDDRNLRGRALVDDQVQAQEARTKAAYGRVRELAAAQAQAQELRREHGGRTAVGSSSSSI